VIGVRQAFQPDDRESSDTLCVFLIITWKRRTVNVVVDGLRSSARVDALGLSQGVSRSVLQKELFPFTSRSWTAADAPSLTRGVSRFVLHIRSSPRTWTADCHGLSTERKHPSGKPRAFGVLDERRVCSGERKVPRCKTVAFRRGKVFLQYLPLNLPLSICH